MRKEGARGARGYGAGRNDESLRAECFAWDDGGDADAKGDAERWIAAERYARRKRIGPYASAAPDPKQREKAIAAFLRAGHSYAIARRWVDAAPGQMPEAEE